MRVETVADCRCEIAEVPMWHPTEERLYWTDIPAGEMYRYDPEADEYEQCYDGGVVGGYTIQADGSFLLFMEAGAVRSLDDDGSLETVVESLPGEEGSRFNDVIADPNGRVFGGTMPTDDGLGTLYRLDTDGTTTALVEDVDLPNGMGFDPDHERFYFTESNTNTIYEFDYDVATGDLSNKRVFVDIPDDKGMADGLTVDEEGYVWSAQFGGGCVVRYAPDGTEDDRYEIPAKNVTSLLFAGNSFDELYVTTAKFEASEDDPLAGGVFRLRPRVSGVEEFYSRVSI
ncbi:MAG: SMP-30/gluconolactonase/LRE family protein [Natronomonas sp.]|uniref:SMP-30/gluconolactonase/LRE family protein n=1 Tax=Natronomonas sp. TaxID=2184060 RepID=UPI0028701ABC|nr:SMP-30/gluconolactonase/LRE family protein [Natronomonas sp.]MDR9429409.1 SMP-30/gluconolactonase/LRE family protein [Natronomonas sp.]